MNTDKQNLWHNAPPRKMNETIEATDRWIHCARKKNGRDKKKTLPFRENLLNHKTF